MGYVATEIIVLLAGAAVLGFVIGWALFGLGKRGAAVAQANPRLETELKAERDQRKKAEMRIVELEAKETNFTEKLQERDQKVAELSHQLDDQAKYRVQSASEIDARDQKLAHLEAQLRTREAELASLAAAPPSNPADEAKKVELEAQLAAQEQLVAKLTADIEAAQAAIAPAQARVRDVERENAELRETLVATANAAPTTTTEKDQVIARLNEEVTGLRAAYEAAEQALEEQDAAIDKLTRDLQQTQQRLLAQDPKPTPTGASPRPLTSPTGSSLRPQAVPSAPIAPQVPAVTLTAVPTPKPAPAAPAPVAHEESESTVAISLDALVAQIDNKPADSKPADSKPAEANPIASMPAAAKPTPTTGSSPRPALSSDSPSNQVAPASKPIALEEENESTMAISLDALVAQIDSKPAPVIAAPVIAAPAPVIAAPVIAAPAPVIAAPVITAPAKAAEPDNESTMAISLDALVAQIDSKPAPVLSAPAPFTPAPSPAPAPFTPAPSPVVAPPAPVSTESLPESESTMAISLDALVAQIDSQAPRAVPAPPPAAEPSEENESTMAISLADLVDHIDAVSDIKINVAPAPEGRIDDLKRIRGVGPTTEKRLNGAGILTWAQMASLTDDDLNQVADLLKVTVDKIKREQWVEQARALRT